MEKNNKISLAIVLIGVVFLFYYFSGGSIGSVVAISDATPNTQTQNSELSGKIVAMDPNRLMAGSPCHVMGGEAAGDCQTREIELEARQWDWSEPIITVKSGEFVRIKGTSKDVNHGISIPRLGFNLILQPGKTTVGGFQAPAPGTYEYGCSVMCGAGHHNHRGKLVVVA